MSDQKQPPVPPEDLEAWIAEVKSLLQLEDEIDVAAVLDLARDLAHNVARPAAPLTAFALGLALGRREGSVGFDELSDRLISRSSTWRDA